MKNSCIRYAMAAIVGATLFASSVSASFSGAIYTSYGNGTTVNANTYSDCELVFLNGGPQNLTGSGIPDGIYLFEVTNPSTSVLLSTDHAKNRQVQVINGRIYGTPGQDSAGQADDVVVAPLFGANPGDMHVLGFYNEANQSVPVRLWEFNPTTNSGGVYKVTLYSVAGGARPGGWDLELYPDETDPYRIYSPGGNSKSDNFRCVHGGTASDENEVVVFGRKYYDANANGVYDGGEEWTSADDRPQVTINLTWGDAGAASVQTDADGLWFYVFTVADGATLSFTACEEVPTDYNQTGPLDDDLVTNPDPLPDEPAPYVSATATGGCWNGTITDTLGFINLNFGNVEWAKISGMKFYDANANGVNDDEAGIEGVEINLTITYADDTEALVSVDTAADGTWEYDVPVGASVKICEEQQVAPWVQTAPEGGCHEIDVTGDQGGLDFGNVKMAKISGMKFLDANVNGVNDDEAGIEGVEIILTITYADDTEALASVWTDEDGNWEYDVPFGASVKICEEEQVDPWVQTAPGGDGCHEITEVTGDQDGLDFGNVKLFTIGGVKFYDKNANGLNDDGIFIPGFKIELVITYTDTTSTTVYVYTDEFGVWKYDQVPDGATVTVSEVMPPGTWVQTAPEDGNYEDIEVTGDRSDLDFGNLCLGAGGGRTLGFWSNKNGENAMKDANSLDPELLMLRNLNLRTAAGGHFDPTAYKQFRDWILSATATNMAYMLSAQLAAMELNVEAGFVTGGAMVFGGDCLGVLGEGNGFISITELMAAANGSLGTHGSTVAAGSVRSYQECLKNALDKANNNLNFVQAGPCPVVYPQ